MNINDFNIEITTGLGNYGGNGLESRVIVLENQVADLQENVDGNFLCLMKSVDQSTNLAAGDVVTWDSEIGRNIVSGNNRFELRKGHGYQLKSRMRCAFSDSTSFAIYAFFDALTGDEINYAYADGLGTRSLVIPFGYTGNNSPAEDFTATIVPSRNLTVEVRACALTSNVTNITRDYTYANILHVGKVVQSNEPTLIVDTEDVVNLTEGQVGHIQDIIDYDSTYYIASFTEFIAKVNKVTGVVSSKLTLPYHSGGLCMHDGFIYIAQTSDFITTSSTNTIYKINPETMTIVAQNTFVLDGAGGCMGSDGTNLYIGLGRVGLLTLELRGLDPSTLTLNGNNKSIAALGNLFGNGVQCIKYYNNKWWFGTYFYGGAPFPSNFNGGAIVIADTNFNILNYIGKESGTWQDTYGTGFVIVDDNTIQYAQSNQTAAPFTHKIVKAKMYY